MNEKNEGFYYTVTITLKVYRDITDHNINIRSFRPAVPPGAQYVIHLKYKQTILSNASRLGSASHICVLIQFT